MCVAAMRYMTLVLTVHALVGLAWSARDCKVFWDVRILSSKQYRCFEDCVHTTANVFGTEVYSKESDICRAALHAGAIGTSGGDFIITRESSSHDIVGTTRNRVVSRSLTRNLNRGDVYKIVKTTPVFKEEDVREDVLVVHNSYSSKGDLYVVCMSQDPQTVLTENDLISWDYKEKASISRKVTVVGGKLLLRTNMFSRDNMHGFRCRGRNSATDVMAAVQFPTSDYQSPTPTVRASKRDELNIEVIKREDYLSDWLYVRRLPDSWSSESMYSPITYSSAQLRHMGLYIAHSSSNEGTRNRNGAYFDVMIRDCEEGKYGVNCNSRCPQCEHGGLCHTQTGSCVCPPGFIGDRCQHACLPGRFGVNCQLKCDYETLEFNLNEDGKCSGITICLPEPYGCSCAPGYTYNKGADNPYCTQECPHGKFGADCSEHCDNCYHGICDSFTGTCTNGCGSGTSCISAPLRPELTAISLRRKLTITWSPRPLDTIYFYTYQFLKYGNGSEEGTSRPSQPHVVSGSSLDIPELRTYSHYRVCLVASNSGGHSPQSCINARTSPEEPDPPESISSVRDTRQLIITVQLPTNPRGTLLNCSVSLSDSIHPCTIHVSSSVSLKSCKFDQLEPGRIFQAKAYCCNEKFCGDVLEKEVATKPSKPELQGHLSVQKKTNSTITISLPNIISNNDGNSSLAVVVHNNQSYIENLTAEAKQLLTTRYSQSARVKRGARQTHECQAGEDQSCQQSVWVAGLLSKETQEFVIGDGCTYNGFVNCPLVYRQAYHVGIMAISILLGDLTYEWQALPGAVVVEPWIPERPGFLLPLLLVLLLLVITIVAIAVYYLHHKKPEKLSLATFHRGRVHHKSSGIGNQALPENEEISSEDSRPAQTTLNPAVQSEVAVHFAPTPDQELPADHPQNQENGDIAVMEPSYENLALEEIYENMSRRIPQVEVEAYLNRTINSLEAKKEFQCVPANLNKSMTAAQHPDNKQKNRFRNNHPYDDTRVKLSLINDDPQSDYINANHVTGYGDMRYIAAQGPKDVKVPTIADFWRMIIEQDINVIIMVANFVEGGKKKVGEYFRAGETLEFDGYFVSVRSREQFAHFAVTSVQVWKSGYSCDIKHYHYTIWPDHGIPNEAVSVARMIQHYQRDQNQAGGTVVHCSAGIGRTGTVLLVLLMCEMLALEGSLDPIEALIRLRESRARLVENTAQYNLGLEILEEILFGEERVVSAPDLETSLDKYLHNSLAEFRKIKALPSPLTYNSASNPAFESMNRNRSVLPADSQRIYLQIENGKIESQYINAIQVPGLNSKEAFLVTEHPLPNMLTKFWRLVVEKGCSHIILINHFDGQSKEEFPDIMPEVGSVWTMAGYDILVQQAYPHGNLITKFTVNITNSGNLSILNRTLQVYQVLSWQNGLSVPSSPKVLLILADLLLQSPRHSSKGPPLLCCGDGVTGCGLVAAMTLLVEHLQTEQCVNVYRTVVKLLRSRHHFITSEEQYSLLYSGAAMYLRDNSTYGNFN